MKLPPETVNYFNVRLEDEYGRIGNQPKFRIVWSEDQFEKRLMSHTPEGWQLLNPEVREVPKYRQWVQNNYILERLTEVPAVRGNDLTQTLSYEPLWVFEDKGGKPLPPTWHSIQFLLANVLEAIRTQGRGVKYKDPRSDPNEAKEREEERIKQLKEELFGNETDAGDALAYGEGVVVPSNYQTTQGDKDV